MSGYSDYQASQKQGQAGEASAEARSRARPSKRGKGKPKAHKPHKGRPHKPALNRLDDPSQVTGPQTLRQIYQSADAATALRYGPQERALGLQQAQVPAYFQQYRDQVQGYQTGVKAGYDKAISDVGARQDTVTAGDNAGRAALMEAAQKDAAARGATVDPSLFANDVSAQTVRNQGQSDFASLLSAQGNANNSYFGGLQAAGSAAELGQKQRIASDRTALAGDKGLFRQGYVTDATDTAFKNKLAAAAFEIPTANTVLSNQTSAANSRRTSRNAAKNRKAAAREKATTPYSSGAFAGKTPAWVRKHPDQAQALSNSYNKLTHPGKGKGTAGLTQTQKAKQRTDANKQVSRITDAEGRWNIYKNVTVTEKKGDKEVKRKPNPSEIKQRLIKEGFSTTEIHLALMWNQNKPWTPRDRRAAKRLGIRLPKRKASKPTQLSGSGDLL